MAYDWTNNTSSSMSIDYKRQYNGKEMNDDFALNLNDYGARWYDAAVGRWSSVDSLGEHPDQIDKTPYQYGWNNPVRYDDPDGNCPWCIVVVVAILVTAPTPLHNSTGNPELDGTKIADAQDMQLSWIGTGITAPIKAEGYAASVVTSSTGKALSASAKNDTKPKTYQTYTKKNESTGKVYSGSTSGTKSPERNVANRDRNHHMSKKGFGPAKLDKSSSNKDAIRGREQQNIDKNGGAQSQGGTSGNPNRAVSKNNPNAKRYESAANREFKKQ
jgi:RHS repeat-associated protein